MAEHPFVEAVQRGRVTQPVSLGFSLGQWEQDYHGIEHPTTEDERLYRSGVMLTSWLESVREQLLQHPVTDLHRNRLRRQLVGFINRESAAADQQYIRDLNKTVVKPQPHRPAGPYVEASPVDYGDKVAAMVDASRFALSEANKASHERCDLSSEEILKRILLSLQLAGVYQTLEELWSECVWNGWTFIADGSTEWVVPTNIEAERHLAAANFRWNALLAEAGIRLGTWWQKLPISSKRAWLEKPSVIGVERTRKTKKLHLGRGSEYEGRPPPSVTARWLIERLYAAELLHERLRPSPLTPADLIEAWQVLLPLSMILSDSYPTEERLINPQTLFQYAPTIPRREVTRVLMEALRKDRETVELIVARLSFSGDVREDMWARPLIPVDEDSLAIVAPVLQHPNWLRNVERWLVAAGIDVSEKGEPFEARVRTALEATTLPNVQVHPQAIQFSVGETEEELDLVVRIGSTVLLGELKNSVVPATAYQRHNYFERLRLAAEEQALRKSRFVEQNLPEFARELGQPEEALSKVVPVVVTNLPFGAGRTYGDVPVVDHIILSAFFIEGQFERMVSVTPEGELVPGEAVVFFDSPEDAEPKLQGYLSDPPQVRRFLDRVVQEPRGYKDLREDVNFGYFTCIVE